MEEKENGMSKTRIISLEEFKKVGLCGTGTRIFNRAFPKGFELSKRGIDRFINRVELHEIIQLAREIDLDEYTKIEQSIDKIDRNHRKKRKRLFGDTDWNAVAQKQFAKEIKEVDDERDKTKCHYDYLTMKARDFYLDRERRLYEQMLSRGFMSDSMPEKLMVIVMDYIREVSDISKQHEKKRAVLDRKRDSITKKAEKIAKRLEAEENKKRAVIEDQMDKENEEALAPMVRQAVEKMVKKMVEMIDGKKKPVDLADIPF